MARLFEELWGLARKQGSGTTFEEAWTDNRGRVEEGLKARRAQDPTRRFMIENKFRIVFT